MKKLLIITTAFLLLILSGCSTPELADIYSEDDITTLGKTVVEHVNAGDYQKINDMTREDLQESLSVEVFETSVAPIITEAGDFVDYQKTEVFGNVDNETDEEYASIIIVANYSEGKITYTLTFNSDDQIVGFYIK